MEFFYLLEENIPVFVFCYNDKFIAAKPAADFFREFVFQNIGKCCNQSVSGFMTVRIICPFQSVYVAE